MADGTIGRANIEIGANTAPLDADLAGAKAKVEQAANNAESAAQNQNAAKAQTARVETTTAQKTQERLAAEIKITQEVLKQGAAKARAISNESKAASDTQSSSGGGGILGSIGGFFGGGGGRLATITAAIALATTAVQRLWDALKAAHNAARDLSNELKSIGDAFAFNKFQAMGEMTRQMEEARQIMSQQREEILKFQQSFAGFADRFLADGSEARVRSEKLANEYAASLKRIREQFIFEQRKQMAEFMLELRKFREELNASAGIGNQPIELIAVTDAIRTLALRSEASR